MTSPLKNKTQSAKRKLLHVQVHITQPLRHTKPAASTLCSMCTLVLFDILMSYTLCTRFGGLRCEADKNPCKTNPCLNAGTCREYNITSFNCTCVPGFEGQTCDVNINDCASSPCPLHSNCIDKVNGYECKCHQSHTGKHCETGNDYKLI